MKLVSMVIDIRSGAVHCSAEMSSNGVLTSVTFTVGESQLIAAAQAAGRYTWDNEDVLRIGTELFGAPIL